MTSFSLAQTVSFQITAYYTIIDKGILRCTLYSGEENICTQLQYLGVWGGAFHFFIINIISNYKERCNISYNMLARRFSTSDSTGRSDFYETRIVVYVGLVVKM